MIDVVMFVAVMIMLMKMYVIRMKISKKNYDFVFFQDLNFQRMAVDAHPAINHAGSICDQ